MTKLEAILNEQCFEAHDGDPFWDNFEYDPKEGHFHIEPGLPECWEEASFDSDPPTIFLDDQEYSIQQLIELKDWLNIVLKEIE